MKSGKVAFILPGVIILAAIFLSKPPSDKLPSTQERKFLLLSCEDFNSLIGGNDRIGATQRKHLFEKYKGRYVRWWGEVEEVVNETSGYYTLLFKPSQAAKDLQISIRFDKSKQQKLLTLKKGDGVNYIGKLADFDSSFGYYLEDGDIE
jgi:hypothetical protein